MVSIAEWYYQQGVEKGFLEAIKERMAVVIEDGVKKGIKIGEKKGLKRGRKEGLELGQQKGQAEIVQIMVNNGCSVEDISRLAKLPLDRVHELLSLDLKSDEDPFPPRDDQEEDLSM